MPDARFRVLKATTLLQRDHRILGGLFVLYDRLGFEAEPARKLRLFNEIRARLEGHTAAEIEIFFPAVERSERRGEDDVVDALEEQQAIRTLLEELEEAEPDNRAFDAKMERLREHVKDHVLQEEQRLFPLFDKLPRELRDDASRALRERLEELEGPLE